MAVYALQEKKKPGDRLQISQRRSGTDAPAPPTKSLFDGRPSLARKTAADAPDRAPSGLTGADHKTTAGIVSESAEFPVKSFCRARGTVTAAATWFTDVLEIISRFDGSRCVQYNKYYYTDKICIMHRLLLANASPDDDNNNNNIVIVSDSAYRPSGRSRNVMFIYFYTPS